PRRGGARRRHCVCGHEPAIASRQPGASLVRRSHRAMTTISSRPAPRAATHSRDVADSDVSTAKELVMRRPLRSLLSCSAGVVVRVALTACTTGKIAVGETNKTGQELQRRSDGGATGNGTTCSWEGTAGYNTGSGAASSYAVGATFHALDGCNECSCTA